MVERGMGSLSSKIRTHVAIGESSPGFRLTDDDFCEIARALDGRLAAIEQCLGIIKRRRRKAPALAAGYELELAQMEIEALLGSKSGSGMVND